MTKPQHPLTDEQEQILIDFGDNYASQYDDLAEWENEVAQFGDATFSRPIIEPFTWPDKLQHWIDLVKQYDVDLAKWKTESIDMYESNLKEWKCVQSGGHYYSWYLYTEYRKLICTDCGKEKL